MTNAELAILSLIVEKPRHGYEIEQTIEERGMREWTEIGFSSIYYLLKKLEKEGLVRSQLAKATGRGPARKVFYLTDRGAEVWQEASLRALGEPPESHSSFLLGLSNLITLPPLDALSALKNQQQHLTAKHAELTVRAQEAGLPFHVQAMFDYSTKMIAANLIWMDEFIQAFEQRSLQDDKN